MASIDLNHVIRKLVGDRASHSHLLQTVKHKQDSHFGVPKLLQVKNRLIEITSEEMIAICLSRGL